VVPSVAAGAQPAKTSAAIAAVAATAKTRPFDDFMYFS
jgi:hypothetical protein